MKKKTDAWKRRVAAGLLSAGAVGGAYLSSNPTSPPQAEKTKDSEVDRILALADEMMKSNERKRDLPISARNWFLTSRSDKALEAAGKTFEEARAKAHELHAEAEDAKTEFQQLRAVLTRAFVHASPQVREAVIKRLKDDDRVDTTDTLPEVTMGVSE